MCSWHLPQRGDARSGAGDKEAEKRKSKSAEADNDRSCSEAEKRRSTKAKSGRGPPPDKKKQTTGAKNNMKLCGGHLYLAAMVFGNQRASANDDVGSAKSQAS